MIVNSGSKPPGPRAPADAGADELAVPGELGDHADVDPVLGLRAAVEVLDVERGLAGKRAYELCLQGGEMVRGHGGIVVPPDRRFGLGIADDELVVGGAARVLARGDDQGAVLGEHAFAAADRMLGQRRRKQVPVQDGPGVDALVSEIERRHSGRHLHSPVMSLLGAALIRAPPTRQRLASQTRLG